MSDDYGGPPRDSLITTVLGSICGLHVLALIVMMVKIDKSAPPSDSWMFIPVVVSLFVFGYAWILSIDSVDQDSAKSFSEKIDKQRALTSKDRSDE